MSLVRTPPLIFELCLEKPSVLFTFVMTLDVGATKQCEGRKTELLKKVLEGLSVLCF